MDGLGKRSARPRGALLRTGVRHLEARRPCRTAGHQGMGADHARRSGKQRDVRVDGPVVRGLLSAAPRAREADSLSQDPVEAQERVPDRKGVSETRSPLRERVLEAGKERREKLAAPGDVEVSGDEDAGSRGRLGGERRKLLLPALVVLREKEVRHPDRAPEASVAEGLAEGPALRNGVHRKQLHRPPGSLQREAGVGRARTGGKLPRHASVRDGKAARDREARDALDVERREGLYQGLVHLVARRFEDRDVGADGTKPPGEGVETAESELDVQRENAERGSNGTIGNRNRPAEEEDGREAHKGRLREKPSPPSREDQRGRDHRGGSYQRGQRQEQEQRDGPVAIADEGGDGSGSGEDHQMHDARRPEGDVEPLPHRSRSIDRKKPRGWRAAPQTRDSASRRPGTGSRLSKAASTAIRRCAAYHSFQRLATSRGILPETRCAKICSESANRCR